MRLQHKLCVQSCGLVYNSVVSGSCPGTVELFMECLYIGGETPGDYPSTHK